MVTRRVVAPRQKQLRTLDPMGDSSVVVKELRCTRCHVTYVEARLPGCPLCQALDRLAFQEQRGREQAATIQTLEANIRGLETSLKTMSAIGAAVEILCNEPASADVTFLTTFYETRRSTTVTMLLDLDPDGRPLFHVRIGDSGTVVESHEMKTIGGIALAAVCRPVARLGGLARMTYALGSCFAAHLKWPEV